MQRLLRQLLLLGALGTLLAPAALGQEASASLVQQGRKNPFRPLIVPHSLQALPKVPTSGSFQDIPAGVLPGIPRDALPPVKLAPLTPPKPKGLAALEYVGIAFDASESVAAVQVDGKLTFVRKGDQLDGAVVTAITPHKLVWRRQSRTIVKHLHRSSGAL